MLYRDPNLSQLAIGSPVLPMQWPLARLFVRSTNGRCACSVALQSTIGKQTHARRQSNPGLVGFGFVMPTAWDRRCQQDYSMIRRDHHVLDRRALAPPTIVGVPAAFVFWPADRPLRAVEQYFPNLGHGRQHFRELSPMTRRQMHCHKLLQHRQQPSDPFANLWLALSKETAHHILSRIGFEIEQNEEQLSFGLRQHTFSTPADRTLAAMPFDGLLRRLRLRCSLPKGKQSLKCICAHARQRPHPSFISQGMLNRNHAIKITRADFYALLPIFSTVPSLPLTLWHSIPFQMGVQKANRQRIGAGALLFLVVGALAVALFARQTPWQDAVGQASYDWLHRLAGEKPLANSSVVIVYLDLASYKSRGLDPLKPWPRELHSQLLHRLTSEGARAVVFDIVFSGASANSTADEALASAIRENARVILASECEYDASHATSDW